MDRELRVSLIAAGAAAALSALVGAFSRVSFGALLLRALLGGLVFGALAFGTAFIFRRFLASAEAQPEAEDEAIEDRVGRNVDIVLPGGDPAELASLGQDEEPFASERGLAGFRQTERPRGATSGASEIASILPLEFEEEPESLLGPDEPETLAAMPIVSRTPKTEGYDAFDDLDVLPDLEGFSDSFAAPEFRDPGPSGDAPTGGDFVRPSGKSGLRTAGGEDLDPVALAQAVRTILKRDQKG